MELCGFLIIMLSLTTVTRAEIEFKSISERLYYSYTSDSETNGHIFDVNTSPFLFYDYKMHTFVINGNVTDGIAELGQEEVIHFKERASGILAWQQGITKEITKLTNGTSVLKKKPSIHIYTEENYTPHHPNTLYCYAEKFYPFEIDINFLINGRRFTGPVQSSQLVVEADWTFNILKYIRIEPQDGDTYSCQAAHISLDQPLTVLLDQPPLIPYSGTIVCAVGIVAAVIGIVITLYMITKIYNRRGNLCTGQFRTQ
ncbi:H-2 class II histocompatibility antigen, A-Q alpha chain-like [Heptranchias perlo]|uniref:H-2 class II histocompatibility antigen, A-Q alpha chain-like n=1 Tax=Heptranchias perlo TaxID=212740 RepID=UPI00355A1472